MISTYAASGPTPARPGGPRFGIVAKHAFAGQVGHVAAGQRLQRALQADLLANASLQFDTSGGGNVAANHSPAVEQDVGGRSAAVRRIAV